MPDSDNSPEVDAGIKNTMSSVLQVGGVLLLLYWCLLIVAPFIGLVAWGLIIAVAIYPLHLSLADKVGSQKRSSIVIVISGLALIVIPTWLTVDSSIASASKFAANLSEGTIDIPPPNPSVENWPLIGERVYATWSDLSANLKETVEKYEAQMKAVGAFALRNLGAGALGVLQFVGSLLVAGAFLVIGESGYRASCATADSIAGPRGSAMIDLTIATIRSVTKGVLGVAIVQTALAVIGLVVMDVPAAGIWGALILVLAIMQLPPWLVLAPIAVWVFSVNDPLPSTIFAVYAMLVSICDMFLKPLFLGRGVEVPMLVILLGAIGGAIWAGVIGLFVGAVVLAIGYQLLMAWVYPEALPDTGAGENVAEQ